MISSGMEPETFRLLRSASASGQSLKHEFWIPKAFWCCLKAVCQSRVASDVHVTTQMRLDIVTRCSYHVPLIDLRSAVDTVRAVSPA